MNTPEKRKKLIKRFVISALVALVFVAIINEVAHIFQKESTDRIPETIEIVIPVGTAERVAAGEAEPSIPSELTFVVGDTLLVTNQDEVDHELGPLFIPVGTSASLLMEDADIITTVIVEDTIPVQFDLDVKTNTTVTLTEPTLIRDATTDLRTGGLNIQDAPTDIILPAGTELPIALEIVVPVDKTVPVRLEVPVNIPLNQTDLVKPFQGLQELLFPYLPEESRLYLCEAGRGFNCDAPTPVKTFP